MIPEIDFAGSIKIFYYGNTETFATEHNWIIIEFKRARKIYRPFTAVLSDSANYFHRSSN